MRVVDDVGNFPNFTACLHQRLSALWFLSIKPGKEWADFYSFWISQKLLSSFTTFYLSSLNVHRRILTIHAVSYYVKRSLYKRSLIKVFTQGKLSTPVIFRWDISVICSIVLKLAVTVFTSRPVTSLWHQGGEEFSERGQIFHTMSNRFELCPKHSSKGEHFFGGLCPLCHSCLWTCSLAYLFRIYNRMDIVFF